MLTAQGADATVTKCKDKEMTSVAKNQFESLTQTLRFLKGENVKFESLHDYGVDIDDNTPTVDQASLCKSIKVVKVVSTYIHIIMCICV